MRYLSRKATRTICVAAAVLLGGSADASPVESPDAYEIVSGATVPVLPPPLRSFFEANQDEVARIAVSHVIATDSAGADSHETDRHVVWLDIAANGAGATERCAAARRFPHDRMAARTLAERKGLDGAGSLPWVLHKHYEMLIEGFRHGTSGEILHQAGALLHFATDAALPFNTTVVRNLVDTGRDSKGNAKSAPRQGTLRYRYHGALLAQLRQRLAYEVRVAPSRYRRLEKPLDTIFSVLDQSHTTAMELITIDMTQQVDRAAIVMESRLEAAALLAANLIGTAWSKADSPATQQWTAPRDGSRNSAASAVDPDAEYVGSRHSTVYHRANCAHVKRIKPDNIVTFSGIQEVTTAGRKPCRACKPDGR